MGESLVRDDGGIWEDGNLRPGMKSQNNEVWWRFPIPDLHTCSHVWVNPSDPPIARGRYSSVVGLKRWEMKLNVVYTCQNCGMAVITAY